MPKRSNDYQQLVKLIQQACSPKGAVITESVEHQTTDGPREVDIQVEGDFGIYRLKIAIEAKAESRPLDITTIEQLASKYRHGDGVHADKVVIVSKAGFTRAAKEKALRSNMELLTLHEAHIEDWSRLVRPGSAQTLIFQTPPHLKEVQLDPPIPGDWKDVVNEGRVLCKCHSKDYGSVKETAVRMLRNHVLCDAKLKTDIDNKIANGGFVTVNFQHCLNYYVVFRGTRYSATHIWITASWGRE